MNQVSKKDRHKNRIKFVNIFRFIDNLIVLNDSGNFERSFREIFPPELELKDKLKVVDDFKGKQQRCTKYYFLICKIIF